MYGLNVHRAVLAAGDRKTGISIHVVDAEYDHGRVLAQVEMPIANGETPETLAVRIRTLEQEFLVETLDRIRRGTLRL